VPKSPPWTYNRRFREVKRHNSVRYGSHCLRTLFDAVRKKLESVSKSSQRIFDNMLCSRDPLCSRSEPLPVLISVEIITEIVKRSFSTDSLSVETVPGMRSIEQDWTPQIYNAIKNYYRHGNPQCAGYLMMQWSNPQAQGAKGDIICQCIGNIFSRWLLSVSKLTEAFQWESYDVFVNRGRNALIALEKIVNNQIWL